MKMQIKKNLVAAHFDSSLLKDSPAESEDGLEKVTTIKFLID